MAEAKRKIRHQPKPPPTSEGEVRETGTAGQRADPRSARTLPPDPAALDRPLTDDEKIDEALLESMDGSDPPAYGGSSKVGCPKGRQTR